MLVLRMQAVWCSHPFFTLYLIDSSSGFWGPPAQESGGGPIFQETATGSLYCAEFHQTSDPIFPLESQLPLSSWLLCMKLVPKHLMRWISFLQTPAQQQTKQTGILRCAKVGFFQEVSHLLKSHCLRKCSASWGARAIAYWTAPFSP